MTGPVLVLIEHYRGVPAETAYQALTLARAVADGLGSARAGPIQQPVQATLGVAVPPQDDGRA